MHGGHSWQRFALFMTGPTLSLLPRRLCDRGLAPVLAPRFSATLADTTRAAIGIFAGAACCTC